MCIIYTIILTWIFAFSLAAMFVVAKKKNTNIRKNPHPRGVDFF